MIVDGGKLCMIGRILVWRDGQGKGVWGRTYESKSRKCGYEDLERGWKRNRDAEGMSIYEFRRKILRIQCLLS